MSNKNHASSQGLVATANLATVYQREIFFQVDPATLDYMDWSELQEMQPSGTHVDLRPEIFLSYLPDLEAEIFFLVFLKKKNQKDIAQLLGLSQPTISYRYRRVLTKLNYLMTLTALNVRGMIDKLLFLKERERDILQDLFFYCNQEMVGKRHGCRQSSVKWIFVKTMRRIQDMERKDPETWSNHYGLLLLLERHLGTRILH